MKAVVIVQDDHFVETRFHLLHYYHYFHYVKTKLIFKDRFNG